MDTINLLTVTTGHGIRTHAAAENKGTYVMQKSNRITRISLRGEDVLNDPQLEKIATFPVAENEEPTRLCRLPDDAPEEMAVQIEQVLGYMKEKLTELERFVYLIRLCDRNAALFHQVLTSDPMRFLLASDTRRNLLEIGLHSRSSARHVRFDPLQWSSRENAVELAV